MCMCDTLCMLYCIVNDGAVLSPSISTPTTTASVDGQSTATVEPVITSTSTDYSNVNIEPTTTHTIMNTTSTSSLSIDQTPSLTSQGTPTSPRPPSDEGMFLFKCMCSSY